MSSLAIAGAAAGVLLVVVFFAIAFVLGRSSRDKQVVELADRALSAEKQEHVLNQILENFTGEPLSRDELDRLLDEQIAEADRVFTAEANPRSEARATSDGVEPS